MSATDRISSAVTTVLWPERLPADGIDRAMAARVVDHARIAGRLESWRAADIQARLADAGTRGELAAGLRDVPGAPRPRTGIHTALRVVAALAVAATAVQVVVWAMIGVLGGWDAPWWTFSAAAGALAVGALWWAAEAPRRLARLVHRAGANGRVLANV